MEQLGAWNVLDVLQDLSQVLNIMPIHGTEVAKVQRFKKVGLRGQLVACGDVAMW